MFAEGDFSQWRRKFDCLANVKEWSEEKIIANLPLYLDGRAFDRFLELNSQQIGDGDNSKLIKIMEGLEKTFAPNRNMKLEEFHNIRLEPGKSAVELLARLRKCVDACYKDFGYPEKEQLICEQLLKSIPSNILPNVLPHTNLKNADAIVEVVDRLNYVVVNPSCSVTHGKSELDVLRAELTEVKDMLHKMVIDNTSNVRKSSRNENDNFGSSKQRNFMCYRCGKIGHMARNCTSENFYGTPNRGYGRP